MHGCRTTCWNMGSLSEAPSLKKANSSSSRSYLLLTAPQLGGGETYWAPSNAMISCRFYACNKFTVTERSWVPWCDHVLETAILWKCPLPLALLALLTPLPWYPLAFLQEGGYGCLTEQSISHYLTPWTWPAVDFCISHHLWQKEMFMMRLERCTNL